MGKFGWSYPAGCELLPWDKEVCEVCGKDVDDCLCPECPICGEQGNPDCYTNHGLVRTPEQIASLQRAEAELAKEAKADAEAAAAEAAINAEAAAMYDRYDF